MDFCGNIQNELISAVNDISFGVESVKFISNIKCSIKTLEGLNLDVEITNHGFLLTSASSSQPEVFESLSSILSTKSQLFRAAFVNQICEGLKQFEIRNYSTRISTVAQLLSSQSAISNVQVLARIVSIRRFPSIIFTHVNDGSSSGVLQAVFDKNQQIKFKNGDCLLLKGDLVKSRGNKQNFDLQVTSILDHMPCDYGKFQLFEHRKTFPRSGINSDRSDVRRMHYPEFIAILSIRNKLREFLKIEAEKLNCLEIQVPSLTCNDCEGSGETLTLLQDDYFSKPVNLTVSGQLHLEAIASQQCRNVFSFSRVFRAQPSVSRFHLCEFEMMECEFVYVKNIDILMDKVELLLKNVLNSILTSKIDDIELVRKKFSKGNWLNYDTLNIKSFDRIRFQDIPCLQGGGHTNISRATEFEILRNANGNAVFVTHFPDSIDRPFYMKRDQQGCTLNFDLLLPGCGELIGGSLREHDFNSLNERSPADLSWYVNLRLDGYPYLAGFGLGIERLIMSILGLSNVKDTIPFPRWKGQCAF